VKIGKGYAACVTKSESYCVFYIYCLPLKKHYWSYPFNTDNKYVAMKVMTEFRVLTQMTRHTSLNKGAQPDILL
jgi:hypothetical protein